MENLIDKQVNQTEERELEIIEKIPENKLKEALAFYEKSTSMEIYVRIPFIIIAILFLIHNFLLAGNSYNIDTYNKIKNTEMTILALILAAVFIIAGIAIYNTSQFKERIRTFGKQYNINKKVLQEEFNALSIHLYGGRGLTGL